MAQVAYWVAHLTSAWPGTPTGAQIAAGNLSSGSPASHAGSESAPGSGLGFIDEATAIAGLAPGTSYTTAWTVYDDTALTYATPVVGAVTTDAAAVVIDAGIGAATATGESAGIFRQTVIATAVGAAIGSGTPAALDRQTLLATGIGSASAAGVAATLARVVTVSTGIGAADASGTPATLLGSTVIAGTAGNADANGIPAALIRPAGIEAGIGAATASGTPASILALRLIVGSEGAAQASGSPVALLSDVRIGARTGDATADGVRATITGEGLAAERDGGGGGGGSDRRKRIAPRRPKFTLDRAGKVFFFDTLEDKREAKRAAEIAVLMAVEDKPKPGKVAKPAKPADVAVPVLTQLAAEVVDVGDLRQFAQASGQADEFRKAAQSRHYQELLQMFYQMQQQDEDDIEFLLMAVM